MILDGKLIAAKIRSSVSAKIAAIKNEVGRAPKLVVVRSDGSSSVDVYVRSQRRSAESLGIDYELKDIPANISQDGLDDIIKKLNQDRTVTAIMIQLPLPKGIDTKRSIELIDPSKDAEGIHPKNLGKLLSGSQGVAPCTALAVMEALSATKIELRGKEAVVVGHSDIVGKPIALMLVHKLATTTICHVATSEAGKLKEHIARADILVVAVGKPNFIKGDWIKEGAIVIDVGINQCQDGVVGDVEFAPAEKRASFITPVPGGIGPITTAILMHNVAKIYSHSR